MPRTNTNKDRVTPVSLVISTVLAVAGIILSLNANKKIDDTSIQIGKASSNNSAPDCDSRWEPWVSKITDITTIIGVKRRIIFKEKFKNRPQTLASMSGINLQTIEQAFGDSLFTGLTIHEINRCNILSVGTSVMDEDESGFTLLVEVALPSRVAERLANYLKNNQPKESTIDDLVGFTSICKYEESDKWMLNFYETIGTINVIWVARAIE